MGVGYSQGGEKWDEYVQGRGFLVRGGEVNVDESTDIVVTDKFVTEKAPRTAVGVLEGGGIGLFSVDGEESRDEGADLYEFSGLIKEVGFVAAINLDGGGSQTVVKDGEVVNEPHCNDVDTICEREVGAITCLRDP